MDFKITWFSVQCNAPHRGTRRCNNVTKSLGSPGTACCRRMVRLAEHSMQCTTRLLVIAVQAPACSVQNISRAVVPAHGAEPHCRPLIDSLGRNLLDRRRRSRISPLVGPAVHGYDIHGTAWTSIESPEQNHCTDRGALIVRL